MTTRILPFQDAGLRFILQRFESHSGCILADEMGLGKTIQAITVINHSKINTVLIVCPAGLKLNWRNELRKWSARCGFIEIVGEKRGEFCRTDIPSDVTVWFTIVNYEQLNKLNTDTWSRGWDLLILDEAHYCKSPKAARTKQVFRIRKRCDKVLALTGTPIVNRPVELFPLLQLIAPDEWDPAGLKGQELCRAGEGAGFMKYATRYCAARKRFFGRKSFWDFSGSSNLDELHQRLRPLMIRRFKRDVLLDLPPKRRQQIALPQVGVKKLLTEEMQLFGELTEDLNEAASKVAFGDISKVRKELAIKKIEPALAFIKDALETAEKVVVFAHHTDMVEGLLKGLSDSDYFPGVITGCTSQQTRQSAVNTFQNDPDCRVIVGSIGAMGTGHTLTAASLVIFAEQSWSPSEMSQAEDRAHRIGQRDSVLIQNLVFENSLDSHMCDVLTRKQEIIDRAINGKEGTA